MLLTQLEKASKLVEIALDNVRRTTDQDLDLVAQELKLAKDYIDESHAFYETKGTEDNVYGDDSGWEQRAQDQAESLHFEELSYLDAASEIL